jgi:hypothetical protein
MGTTLEASSALDLEDHQLAGIPAITRCTVADNS